MSPPESKSRPPIGFLTVRKVQELGLIGGYLVLNPVGRPLEFHCTAPVRPNRAQEVLYGPTLEPFLCGEVIGQALLKKSKHQVGFVLTDIGEVTALREHISVPVVFLPPSGSNGPATPGAGDRNRIDAPHAGPPAAHFQSITFGGQQACLPKQYLERDRALLAEWDADPSELDLHEPFQRLAEAIDETQSGATRS